MAMPMAERSALRYWLELIWVIAIRSLRVQYSQSVLGIAWVVLQPFVLLVVLSFVFTLVLPVSTAGAPFPAVLGCGLAVWFAFFYPVTYACPSLIEGANLVTKVAFPREVLPIAAALRGLLDALLVLVMLFLLLLILYRLPDASALPWLLPLVPIQVSLAIGASILVAVLNAYYRDVGMAIPLLFQVAMYLTPVFYSSQMIPERLRPIALLNPLAVFIEAYRQVLLFGQHPAPWPLVYAAAFSLSLLLVAIAVFKRAEGRLADVL
jgi:lipopolysaccharide transport system permease protein